MPSMNLSSSADATTTLLEEIRQTDVEPLWAKMTKLNPPEPQAKAAPHVWRYDSIRPFLLRAGELVTEKQAERRVLMLINPNMEAPCTTDTLYAGLQLVMPGETAPAHRHTATAVRFIIEGQGGFTSVHGKRIQMQRGDVISTPQWQYHDHGKDGNGPMIWLDGLDLPQFQHFPVHFVEHFAEPRYPAEDGESNLVWPWKEMKARLDAVAGPWSRREYRKDNGDSVSRVIGTSAERVYGQAPQRQETASSVYHVIEGVGTVTIDGNVSEVKRGDTFCVPAWKAYQIEGEMYLYRFDDKPMLEKLGFYRNRDYIVHPYDQ